MKHNHKSTVRSFRRTMPYHRDYAGIREPRTRPHEAPMHLEFRPEKPIVGATLAALEARLAAIKP